MILFERDRLHRALSAPPVNIYERNESSIMNCMEELGELNGNFCPFCGFNAAQNPQPPEALPRESILHGKYLIGDVLGRGGFGITYIGFDLSLESKVAIKEYYPSGSAMRREGESSLYWNSTHPSKGRSFRCPCTVQPG